MARRWLTTLVLTLALNTVWATGPIANRNCKEALMATKLETPEEMAARLYPPIGAGSRAGTAMLSAIRARDAQIRMVLEEEAKAWDAGIPGTPYTADHGIAITLRA